MRHLHRSLHSNFGQLPTGDDEVHVDFGKHFGIDRAAFGGQFHLATRHIVTTTFQDQHHVVGRATAGAGQHGFHRARRQVVAAAFGRAVHGDEVAAAGFGQKGHAVVGEPIDGAVHGGYFL